MITLSANAMASHLWRGPDPEGRCVLWIHKHKMSPFSHILYSLFASLVFLSLRFFAVVGCIWRWYDSSTLNVTMWARNIDAISFQTLCTIIVLYIIITYGVRFSCHCFLLHLLFLSRRVAPGAFWRWSRHRFSIWFFVWSCSGIVAGCCAAWSWPCTENIVHKFGLLQYK